MFNELLAESQLSEAETEASWEMYYTIILPFRPILPIY